MPPAALTLSSHIFQTTSCFLPSSASEPVSASGAPILITSAALAGSGNAPSAAKPAAAPAARMSMSLVNCMTLSDVSETPFVIAGLDPASRVYPTCGALLMCGPRASPRSDAIHLLRENFCDGDGPAGQARG